MELIIKKENIDFERELNIFTEYFKSYIVTMQDLVAMCN